jgi:hypothetical protein
MQKIPALVGAALLCLSLTTSSAQSADSVIGKALSFPSRLFSHIQSKTAHIDQQLSVQTEKMLKRMQQKEAQMANRLEEKDRLGAKQLFANSQSEYALLLHKLSSDSGSRPFQPSGQYQPYVDSLQGSLSFLKGNPQLIAGNAGSLPANLQNDLHSAATGLVQAQAKIQVATEAKAFVQQRKQLISQYIAQHASVQNLLSKPFSAMNRETYYYGQRLQQYREMLNSPDKLEKQALAKLSGLPAFQTFMKNNSQLSGLFKIPGSGGGLTASTAQPIPGLQTHSQVSQQVQGQVSASGDAGMGVFQSKLQSAQSQLNSYKNKLSQLGAGAGPGDVPDFRPNDQKTKTLWHRLEYGANFQTTHTNYYYPIVTDLGLSLGYRLGHGRVIGVGASYKMGWGSGINHISISSQGVGLRSFLQLPIKSSFSATGGFEYNHTTPFTSYQQLKQLQYWTKSGLVGVTKTISMKSRVFKKTQLQLLWDFLSYQQVPKTQPVLFRIGYNF